MATDPLDIDLKAAASRLGRACRRRCPNCGAGGLFTRWLRLVRTCPGCSLKLDRGENDYFIGALLVNFVAAELVVVLGGFVVVLTTWPDVPWVLLKWGLMALMVPMPILFYPFAKTLWLALDLTFRPVTWNDLEGHGENRPTGSREGPAGPA